MDRPRRIALLSEHASPVALLGSEDAGGQNVYVDQVSRNLARCGYLVDVFTRRDSATAPEVIEWAPGVRVVNMAAGPPEFLLKDALWQYMPDFRDACERFALREGIRYDVIHGNFWMSGWVATQLRRRMRAPVVQIFHAMGKTKQRHQGASDTSPAQRIDVELRIVRAADRILAQCPCELAELTDDYGADPARIDVIPSAVDTEMFRPVPRARVRRKLGIGPDELVAAYVGRMLPRKDVRNVVRAIALLERRYREGAGVLRRPVTLLVVGGETYHPDPAATPEIGALQQLAAELGVTHRVRFVGKRQQQELRDYYSAGDVAVTTPWYEPFGLTPLEAMACGRPVVGSAVGGLTYTIRAGETGLLVPPRDPEALADRLAELLGDSARRARMGRAARARVEREFTWPTVAARTAAVYERLLMGRSRRPARFWAVPPTTPAVLALTDILAADTQSGELTQRNGGNGGTQRNRAINS